MGNLLRYSSYRLLSRLRLRGLWDWGDWKAAHSKGGGPNYIGNRTCHCQVMLSMLFGMNHKNLTVMPLGQPVHMAFFWLKC
jgi:hypothetical protein